MKAYVKPDVCYEDFQLSTHIASCTYKMTNSTDISTTSACYDSNTGLFASDSCEFQTSLEDLEKYCYTGGPSGGNNTFQS